MDSVSDRAPPAVAYAPIRRNYDGTEFISLSGMRGNRGAVIAQIRNDNMDCPDWCQKNPVVRIARLTITES